VASLLGNGEAQDAWSARTRRIVCSAFDGKPDGRKHQIAHRDGKGWLEAEWTEGATKDTGIPADPDKQPEPGAGVRASIVALKPGNAGGAKGRRKMNA